MREFLFKLFRLEYEKPYCRSCQMLEMLLESERRDKHRILDDLLAKDEPVIQEVPQPVNRKPIESNKVPWPVLKQRMEQEDALKAKMFHDEEVAKSIQKLEEELEIGSAHE